MCERILAAKDVLNPPKDSSLYVLSDTANDFDKTAKSSLIGRNQGLMRTVPSDSRLDPVLRTIRKQTASNEDEIRFASSAASAMCTTTIDFVDEDLNSVSAASYMRNRNRIASSSPKLGFLFAFSIKAGA